MNCEIKIDSLTEEEKLHLIPSYLVDFDRASSYDTVSYTENLVDKIRQIEDDLKIIREKLRKIERVMPWVSEDFQMDENKNI